MKYYNVLVQFDTHNVRVRARNKREAGKKAKEKMKGIPAYRFMDKHNFFVDEEI